MISMTISGVVEARQLFGSDVVDQALKSTLNKLAEQGKTAVSREILKTYNVKARDLGSQIRVIKARSVDGGSQIIASGPRMSLIYFDAQETVINGIDAIITKRATGKNGSGGLVSRKVRKGRKQRGVTVKVLNDQGRKLVKGPLGIGGFFAQGQNSGSNQIFMRVGKNRLPIEKLTGPAVAQMLGKNVNIVQEFINNESGRIFSHELDFFASKVINRGI